jgi:V-type H+-transporting ATPase subunit G
VFQGVPGGGVLSFLELVLYRVWHQGAAMNTDRTGLKIGGGPASETDKTADTVRLLLSAETEAAERIQQARKQREERVRQAVVEAEKEIAAYRAHREASYRQAQEELAGTSEEIARSLQARAEQLVNADQALVAGRYTAAVEALVQTALECEPR